MDAEKSWTWWRSFRELKGIEDTALREWRDPWQAAAGDYDEFTFPLGSVDALIRYRTTEDPRILLEFPAEERELLRHLLQSAVPGEE